MAEFSLAGFAAHLTALTAKTEHAKHDVLDKASAMVQAEAKRVIGTYDYGWPRLADSTLARKAADTPLLETGEMRASIERTVGHDEAAVGSNNDKAVWHELGTSKVPPRPFLLGAATHKERDIQKLAGTLIVTALKQA